VEPAFLFTGIYLVEPAFLQRIPTGTKISVIPLFLDMIRQGAGLGGVVIDAGRWWDLGTREEVLRVHRALAAEEAGPALAAGCEVAASARLNAACAVGAGAVIGPGAVLEDTVVWPGAKVEAESKLSRCIVTSGQVVRGTHDNIDFA
jgi:NDP-sugar pyrophosphorylase family protein